MSALQPDDLSLLSKLYTKIPHDFAFTSSYAKKLSGYKKTRQTLWIVLTRLIDAGLIKKTDRYHYILTRAGLTRCKNLVK